MSSFGKSSLSKRVLAALAGVGLATAVGCQTWPKPTNAGAGGLVRDPERQFQAPVDSWQQLKEENVVMQKHDYSCGAAAVATVAQYFWGDHLTEEELLQTMLSNLTVDEIKDRVKNGLSMTDLRHGAIKHGYAASIGKLTLAKLPDVKVPIIVRIHVNGQDHFVVYRGLVGDRVFLADSIRGNLRLSIDEFAEQWRDRALLVIAKKGVKPPTSAPLLVQQHEPVQPELQAGRRSLFLSR